MYVCMYVCMYLFPPLSNSTECLLPLQDCTSYRRNTKINSIVRQIKYFHTRQPHGSPPPRAEGSEAVPLHFQLGELERGTCHRTRLSITDAPIRLPKGFQGMVELMQRGEKEAKIRYDAQEKRERKVMSIQAYIYIYIYIIEQPN